jgi:hypothetical protein
VVEVSEYAAEIAPELRYKYHMLQIDGPAADIYQIVVLLCDIGYKEVTEYPNDQVLICNLTLDSITSLITSISRKYNNVLFQAFNYQEAFEEQSLNDEQAQAEYDYYEANGGVCDHDVARNKCKECNN